MTLAEIMRVYAGSDGEATKLLYARLEDLGPMGHVAANLFRAHKCSTRAKLYRRGSFKREAYGRKQWSLDNLDTALREKDHGLKWGWTLDPKQEYHCWVLYVEIPTGQMSFHAGMRGAGPDFDGEWDGEKDQGSARICTWIARLFGEPITASTLPWRPIAPEAKQEALAL